jgi:hypothetical protein
MHRAVATWRRRDLLFRRPPRCAAGAERAVEMKWLVISIFATASLSALLWFESDERNYTPVQKAALLVTSLTAWGLVLLLGAMTT